MLYLNINQHFSCYNGENLSSPIIILFDLVRFINAIIFYWIITIDVGVHARIQKILSKGVHFNFDNVLFHYLFS